MNPLIGIITYVGTYKLYVEGLNMYGLKSGFKGRGKWKKAITFPYWDNWSWTHIIWGGFGAILNLNIGTMFALSAMNEFIYEPYRCEKYAKGDLNINYAQHCDPVGHKVADAIYTMVGYGLIKPLRYL